MAYYLLQHDRAGAKRLAEGIDTALRAVQHCVRCNTFTESETCDRCTSSKRDPTQLCIVETPVDMNMMEQAHAYNGLYYVLMGRISPLDGVGPRELKLDRLLARAGDGIVREVILATNYTNEGEATAHYLSELLKSRGIAVTRIARGCLLAVSWSMSIAAPWPRQCANAAHLSDQSRMLRFKRPRAFKRPLELGIISRFGFTHSYSS